MAVQRRAVLGLDREPLLVADQVRGEGVLGLGEQLARSVGQMDEQVARPVEARPRVEDRAVVGDFAEMEPRPVLGQASELGLGVRIELHRRGRSAEPYAVQVLMARVRSARHHVGGARVGADADQAPDVERTVGLPMEQLSVERVAVQVSVPVHRREPEEALAVRQEDRPVLGLDPPGQGLAEHHVDARAGLSVEAAQLHVRLGPVDERDVDLRAVGRERHVRPVDVGVGVALEVDEPHRLAVEDADLDPRVRAARHRVAAVLGLRGQRAVVGVRVDVDRAHVLAREREAAARRVPPKAVFDPELGAVRGAAVDDVLGAPVEGHAAGVAVGAADDQVVGDDRGHGGIAGCDGLRAGVGRDEEPDLGLLRADGPSVDDAAELDPQGRRVGERELGDAGWVLDLRPGGGQRCVQRGRVEQRFARLGRRVHRVDPVHLPLGLCACDREEPRRRSGHEPELGEPRNEPPRLVDRDLDRDRRAGLLAPGGSAERGTADREQDRRDDRGG